MMRKIHIYIKDYLFRISFFAFFLIFTPSLYADIITLKDGKSFSGYFLKMQGHYMIFSTQEGEKKIPNWSIKKIQIQYSGVEACYVLKKTPEKKDCSGILHKISEKKIIIASKDRNSKKMVLPILSVKEILFTKRNQNQKLFSVLRPGITLTLNGKERRYYGKILSINNNSLLLETKDKQVVSLIESDISSGRFLLRQQFPPKKLKFHLLKIGKDPLKPKMPKWEMFLLFAPGFYQIHQNRYYWGAGFLASYSFLGIMFVYELSMAQKEARAAASDPNFLLFNRSSHVDAYYTHQNNQLIIGGLAFALYLFHLYDVHIFESLFRNGNYYSLKIDFGYSYFPLKRGKERINEIRFSVSLY